MHSRNELTEIVLLSRHSIWARKPHAIWHRMCAQDLREGKFCSFCRMMQDDKPDQQYEVEEHSDNRTTPRKGVVCRKCRS